LTTAAGGQINAFMGDVGGIAGTLTINQAASIDVINLVCGIVGKIPSAGPATTFTPTITNITNCNIKASQWGQGSSHLTINNPITDCVSVWEIGEMVINDGNFEIATIGFGNASGARWRFVVRTQRLQLVGTTASNTVGVGSGNLLIGSTQNVGYEFYTEYLEASAVVTPSNFQGGFKLVAQTAKLNTNTAAGGDTLAGIFINNTTASALPLESAVIDIDIGVCSAYGCQVRLQTGTTRLRFGRLRVSDRGGSTNGNSGKIEFDGCWNGVAGGTTADLVGNPSVEFKCTVLEHDLSFFAQNLQMCCFGADDANTIAPRGGVAFPGAAGAWTAYTGAGAVNLLGPRGTHRCGTMVIDVDTFISGNGLGTGNPQVIYLFCSRPDVAGQYPGLGPTILPEQMVRTIVKGKAWTSRLVSFTVYELGELTYDVATTRTYGSDITWDAGSGGAHSAVCEFVGGNGASPTYDGSCLLKDSVFINMNGATQIGGVAAGAATDTVFTFTAPLFTLSTLNCIMMTMTVAVAANTAGAFATPLPAGSWLSIHTVSDKAAAVATACNNAATGAPAFVLEIALTGAGARPTFAWVR
jgi:hypothetical protein